MADYYPNPGDETGTSASAPPETKPKPEDQDETTALLPKTILGGKEFEPGDEVVLKIVHIYEDEVEVAYAPEKGKEEGEEGSYQRGPKSQTMMDAEDHLASMAE